MEIMRRYYEAYARGGFDRWMEQFAEDVEYWPAAGELGGVGPIHGRKALRAYFQDWIDTFDEFWFELIELIDAGGDAPDLAASKLIRPKRRSSRFATERLRSAASTGPVTKPSKPPGCRSKQ